MQYLKLTDGYDNNINKNLLYNTTQGFYTDDKITYNGVIVREEDKEAIAWSDTDNIISLRNRGETLILESNIPFLFMLKQVKT